jgi:hypothetical protein
MMIFNIDDFVGATNDEEDYAIRLNQVCDVAYVMMTDDETAEAAWEALSQDQRVKFIAHVVAAAKILEEAQKQPNGAEE